LRIANWLHTRVDPADVRGLTASKSSRDGNSNIGSGPKDICGAIDRLSALLGAIPDLIFVLDIDGNQVDVLASDPPQRPRSRTADGACLPSSRGAMLLSTIRRAISTGQRQIVEYPGTGELRERLFEGQVVPLPGGFEPGPCVLWLVRDVTEARRTEAALRAKLSVFQGFIDHSPAAIVLKDAEGRYLFVNRTFEEWFRRPASELIGKVVFDLLPEAVAERSAELDRNVRARNGVVKAENTVVFPDGTERRIMSTKFPVRDEDGSPTCVGSVMADVTDFRRTQEQLRQAQKMEAIGELASGIAHDFNNLLVVILGNLELLIERTGDAAAVRCRADDALKAAERGAALAQRLLTFSRRQPLTSAVADLKRLVPDIVELARHALPAHIEIVTNLAEDTWPALIDRGQLENALLNLAVNARDAMPAGGVLTFETGNLCVGGPCTWLEPEFGAGPYTTITVTDTGTGMTREVLERATEPFFTTKTEGTGLGLSMVHNFAKQSRGHVRIHSEVGYGTTIRLYLPRAADGTIEAIAPEAAPAQAESRESILVVEDEAGVRRYVAHVLRRLGYAVIEAEDGAAALRALEDSGPVDLLFADVVLPGGVNGQELAERAVEIHPEIEVLFTSAYDRTAILGDRGSARRIDFLVKPITREQLACKVREVLDRPARKAAA
jgi:PAS domain S-box-containing protein